jgi:hypothetical protein
MSLLLFFFPFTKGECGSLPSLKPFFFSSLFLVRYLPYLKQEPKNRLQIESWICFETTWMRTESCSWNNCKTDPNVVSIQQSESELLYDWRFIANQFVVASAPWGPRPEFFFNWIQSNISGKHIYEAFYHLGYPRSPFKFSLLFGGTYRLHFQGRRISQARNLRHALYPRR